MPLAILGLLLAKLLHPKKRVVLAESYRADPDRRFPNLEPGLEGVIVAHASDPAEAWVSFYGSGGEETLLPIPTRHLVEKGNRLWRKG